MIHSSPDVQTESNRATVTEKNETTKATSHTPPSATSRMVKGPTPYGPVASSPTVLSPAGVVRSETSVVSSYCSSVTIVLPCAECSRAVRSYPRRMRRT